MPITTGDCLYGGHSHTNCQLIWTWYYHVRVSDPRPSPNIDAGQAAVITSWLAMYLSWTFAKWIVVGTFTEIVHPEKVATNFSVKPWVNAFSRPVRSVRPCPVPCSTVQSLSSTSPIESPLSLQTVTKSIFFRRRQWNGKLHRLRWSFCFVVAFGPNVGQVRCCRIVYHDVPSVDDYTHRTSQWKRSKRELYSSHNYIYICIRWQIQPHVEEKWHWYWLWL